MKLRTILIMVAVLIALGVAFVFLRPKPESLPVEPSKAYLWNFDMMELQRIGISLPKEGKNQAWVKHEDRYFYFDEPNGPKVDMARWGGGIPLLLSGPAAARIIAEHATVQQLELYGLDEPGMQIDLILDNGDTIQIELGDSTPNGQAYYIRRADSHAVYTIDYTWHDVMERLVLDPPYPDVEEE
jgi:hypothetical protein